MALVGQDIDFFYTGAPAHQDPQFDPNASLGDFVSSIELHSLESSLTANQTESKTLTDANAFAGEAPSAADTNELTTDAGNYDGAANLRYWFLPGRNPTLGGFGRNYAGTPISFDLTDTAESIDVANFAADQPGQFENTRQGYDFPGALDFMQAAQSTGTMVGMADEWTQYVIFRFDGFTNAFTTQTLYRISNISPGFDELEVAVVQNGGGPHDAQVTLGDFNTSGFNAIATCFAAITVGTWYSVAIRWDGPNDSLRVWTRADLGTPTEQTPTFTGTALSSITQSDSNKFLTLGCDKTSFFGETGFFEGIVFACAGWDTPLSAAAIEDMMEFGDGPRVLPVDEGDYLAFQTGGNAIQARRVSGVDTSTGEIYFVDDPWVGLANSGDVYRVYKPNSVFDSLTPANSVQGHVDHRAIGMINATGVTLTDFRWYIEPLDPGPTNLFISAGNNNSLVTFARDIDAIAVETDTPDVLDDLDFNNGGPGFFSRPLEYDGSSQPPDFNADLDINNNGLEFIWLKRELSGINRAKTRCAYLVVVEGTNAGGDPDPIRSCFVVSFAVAGFAANAAITVSPLAYIGGGATVEVIVTDADTGVRIPAVPVEFSINSGPGSLVLPVDPIETDTLGAARVTYLSSTNEGDVGAAVTVDIEVN